ncbi:Galactose-1-phosphate uridylyltransferase [Venturia nashicola]|uniref:RNA polymerase II subunit B1 CTD phosphatase RPAP2 homolog n=1 Tax=Venturia nashicola TaxID=86259 RepID=A0A4Z1PFX8_9PEZI|nr:Galactose-1-phosphate uridylyltransferase [Venturia nashicola]TLD32175.1 Galactose-1-phosphate uridylyltransferase [Venturia nashicola]
MALKSILKKTADIAETEEPSPRDKRNLEIALYHANLIQAQKDAEKEILNALETLMDFPADSSSTSSEPSRADVQIFKNLIQPFQPSDYDALFEERRIAERCGYVFCPNPPKQSGRGGKFKFLGGKKGQDLRVVEKQKTECWCSSECAHRALYVRVQLDEEPAWLRRGEGVASIQLLTERDDEEKRGSNTIDQEALRNDLAKLKVERGEPGRMMPKGIITDTVMERVASTSTQAAAPKQEAESPGTIGLIEGYAPRGVKIGSRTKSIRELGDIDFDSI